MARLGIACFVWAVHHGLRWIEFQGSSAHWPAQQATILVGRSAAVGTRQMAKFAAAPWPNIINVYVSRNVLVCLARSCRSGL
jgi:hypothetical protein